MLTSRTPAAHSERRGCCMGIEDDAGGRQNAIQSRSADLSARAGEGLKGEPAESTSRNMEAAATLSVEPKRAGINSRAPDASDAIERQALGVMPVNPKRRPLTNEFRRLDNLVLLKQEIKKLQQEVKELRDGERRRLDDMRSQADSHKSEMSQLSRLTHRESVKLMTELRGKDRCIERLQRDLSMLRSHCDKLTMKGEDPAGPSPSRRSRRAAMPPDTAKERSEDGRGSSNGTDAEWPRKKLGGRMLEFINSQLQDDEAKHRTVVFVPPPCSPLQIQEKSSQTDIQYSSISTQTSKSNQLREQSVQTEPVEAHCRICGCNQLIAHLPPDTGQLSLLDTGQQLDQPQQRPTKQEVCLETLYGVLVEEHVGLAWQACRHERRAADAEAKLAESITQSEKSTARLEAKLAELSEENDLLEFRLLEIEQTSNHKQNNLNVPDGTRWDQMETDDISDSGVMSLPTSEDDISMCDSEGGSDVIKWRLLGGTRLGRSESPSDRACLQETLAILSHQEAKLQHMVRYGEGKMVAAVPPFSSVEKRECDILEESGIFEEPPSTSTRHTQTDLPQSQGDLTQEIRKLAQIKERIEESKAPPAESRELLYCRERLNILEERLKQYEELPQNRETRDRLETEARLRAQIQRLEEKSLYLKQENVKLEEQCSELEEAENDTRLICQKLEVKVSSLGEKKNSLKAQLEQNARAIAELKNSVAEEEMKKVEAQQQVNRLETAVHQYEKKNFELEEREMEVRYRLQVLENTLPGIMMWNMWRMMMVMQMGMAESRERENELLTKLKTMETQLSDEASLLEESRNAESELKEKVDRLEEMLGNSEEEGLEVADRVSKLALEKEEKEKIIKDLELRENLYRETLQRADSMFAEMESDYTKQLREREKEIREKELQLSETESKMRRMSKENENSATLQERLHSLEYELRNTRQNLNRKEQDRVYLKQEEERLKTELQSCLEENHVLRTSLDTARSELDIEKKNNRELNQLLNRVEFDNNSIQQEHETEVSKYRKQIKKLNMELMESEVTISELKEEVQTLELAIEELREELRSQMERTEDVRVRLEAELEQRIRKLEQLEGIMSGNKQIGGRLNSTLKGDISCSGLSLMDELEQAEKKRPVPAARSDSHAQRPPVPHPRKTKDNPQT